VIDLIEEAVEEINRHLPETKIAKGNASNGRDYRFGNRVLNLRFFRPGELFENPATFDAWATKWRESLTLEKATPVERADAMRAVNPAFIPRNHRIEAAIIAAQTNSDFSLFEELVSVLAAPFDDRPELARYADPPRPDEIVQQTFCGT
jgi:uncharacterized protein YdiU (UPF0061 family)